ncbi:hypothetical protein L7F22_028691 [Adiantum nelumboides]|nr:hypothetical protein [Adiantum nelumboides]
MLRLRSSDGEIFEVDLEAVASQSLLVRDMVDINNANYGEAILLPLYNVSDRVLAKVLDYILYHGTLADVPSSVARGTQEDADEQWDEQFLDSLDEENLSEVMRAAHYLNIPKLQHLTCVRAGEGMRGMIVEEARIIFDLPSDFTPEEDAAIRRQTDMLLEFLHRLNIRE